MLQQGGFRRQRAVATFFGLKVISTILFIVLAVMGHVFARTTLSTLESVLAGVAIALLGWYLPDIALRLIIAHRKELFLDGFPDALDLIRYAKEIGLETALSTTGDLIARDSERSLSIP